MLVWSSAGTQMGCACLRVCVLLCVGECVSGISLQIHMGGYGHRGVCVCSCT